MKAWKTSDEYLTAWKNKVKNTTFKKYGVEHTSQLQSTKEKAKQTFLKKYGAISPTLNPEIRKKQIDTNKERYGTKTPLENKNIFEKTRKSLKKNFKTNSSPFDSQSIRQMAKETKIKKYGNAYFNNRRKAEETNLLKYGRKNASESDAIKDKTKSTCLEKYGCESPFQSHIIKKKIKQTMLSKYCVINPMQCTSILEKQKCNRLKSTYQKLFLEKFSNIITPLFSESDYVGTTGAEGYKFKCNTCGSIFEDHIYNGRIPRCPICFPAKIGTSKYEAELENFLIELIGESNIERNNRIILSGQEIDFFIPSKKLAIELDGDYWHSEVSGKKYKNYHLNKTNKCEEAGITLLHIFEDEWVQKSHIIKNKLTYLLRPDIVEKIHGRKCKISSLSSFECNEFLNARHLQGGDKSSIRYGAYLDGKLVAVATFGKLRIALGKKTSQLGEYELYRYCSAGRIMGILSRLISRFIKDHSPKKIITYADRRFSNQKTCGYSKCGFNFVKRTCPNYWYLDKSYGSREHRFNYRKSILKSKLSIYNPQFSEWENMQLNGYDRIWDCGHLKYQMDIS